MNKYKNYNPKLGDFIVVTISSGIFNEKMVFISIFSHFENNGDIYTKADYMTNNEELHIDEIEDLPLCNKNDSDVHIKKANKKEIIKLLYELNSQNLFWNPETKEILQFN